MNTKRLSLHSKVDALSIIGFFKIGMVLFLSGLLATAHSQAIDEPGSKLLCKSLGEITRQMAPNLKMTSCKKESCSLNEEQEMECEATVTTSDNSTWKSTAKFKKSGRAWVAK